MEMHSDITKDGDRLLTPKEAGAYLGVSPSTLARWAMYSNSSVPRIRVGGRIRYRVKHIEAYLNKNTEGLFVL